MGALIHFHEGITNRQSTSVRGFDGHHGKHGDTNEVNPLSSARTMTQQPHSPLTHMVKGVIGSEMKTEATKEANGSDLTANPAFIHTTSKRQPVQSTISERRHRVWTPNRKQRGRLGRLHRRRQETVTSLSTSISPDVPSPHLTRIGSHRRFLSSAYTYWISPTDKVPSPSHPGTETERDSPPAYPPSHHKSTATNKTGRQGKGRRWRDGRSIVI